jgi:hypothetical protein
LCAEKIKKSASRAAAVQGARPASLGDRLDNAGLVVGALQRQHRWPGLTGDHPRQRFQIDAAILAQRRYFDR